MELSQKGVIKLSQRGNGIIPKGVINYPKGVMGLSPK